MTAENVWDILRWIHFLALSLWLGGIVFLVLIAVSAVHRSMVSRALAGEIVSGMLKRLNYLEIFACLVLLVTSVSSAHFLVGDDRAVLCLTGLVLAMGAVTAVYAFYLTPRMESLKSDQPGFEALEDGHEVRIRFKKLHQYYVQLMGLNMFLGLVTLYVSVAVFG